MNKLNKLIPGLALIALLSLLIAFVKPFDHLFDPLPQKIFPIKISRQLGFAGEPIPVDYFDIVERLERELLLNSYQHSSMVLHMKLAGRYFPFIQKTFRSRAYRRISSIWPLQKVPFAMPPHPPERAASGSFGMPQPRSLAWR